MVRSKTTFGTYYTKCFKDKDLFIGANGDGTFFNFNNDWDEFNDINDTYLVAFYDNVINNLNSPNITDVIAYSVLQTMIEDNELSIIYSILFIFITFSQFITFENEYASNHYRIPYGARDPKDVINEVVKGIIKTDLIDPTLEKPILHWLIY